MQILNHASKENKLSLFKKIKARILHWFRLTNAPVIKVYHGYGTAEKIIVFGHVLRLSPRARKKYRQNFITNTFAMLRLFMVKPYKKAILKMDWGGVIYEAHTEDDGFFKFEFKPGQNVSPGWHGVKVDLVQTEAAKPIYASGEFFIPYPSQYAFISDIDDTFLISHSSKLRKRLYVLLRKNPRSRKPFEGVVNHYGFLAAYGAEVNTHNPFFFVSSSEWNLYDYIVEFSRINKLPKGVYLLNQLKVFSQVWKTGQNNHGTKFMRIARIMEAYPNQKFILLGDDSQEDPNIYAAVVQHFPGMIHAVYLRHVRKSSWERVKGIVEKLESSGVHACYFKHSAEAVMHSKKNGLISKV